MRTPRTRQIKTTKDLKEFIFDEYALRTIEHIESKGKGTELIAHLKGIWSNRRAINWLDMTDYIRYNRYSICNDLGIEDK